MAQETFRQDMPPPGGYRDFNLRRTYPKLLWKPKIIVPTVGVLGIIGYFQSKMHHRKQGSEKFLDVDLCNAIQPFIEAERDRRWLKLMRKHRHIENDLMKNVPGWKTGTWYGEPVYFTLGDRWFDPWGNELFCHHPTGTLYNEAMWKHHTSDYSAPKWYDKWIPDFVCKFIWADPREMESLKGKLRT